MSHTARILLLGSGELGREFVISAKRLGAYVIACDSYDNAPAMQVADAREAFSMLDGPRLEEVIARHKPDHVVPEVEAIRTEVLAKLEGEGVHIVPSAKAAQLTMNRDGIRDLAARELGVRTSTYDYAENFEQVQAAADKTGFPCVIKPVMSSSGKGQSVIRSDADIESAWVYSQQGGRSGAGRVIVEGFIDFDYEITLLTVRHSAGTSFCAPIGHRQEDGDYRESWQPHPMSEQALSGAQAIALSITDSLGGYGVFGVELFVQGDEVWFSEVSPRPHDTGMVTMISQDLSQFALHVRAILGHPVPAIRQLGPSASAALLIEGDQSAPQFGNLAQALAEPGTQLRLFGKPSVKGRRRMGVALASGQDIHHAKATAIRVAQAVEINTP